MKTHSTIAGNAYTVTSPNGGTVTDASGKLNKAVAEGDQLTVVAPSEALYCSDDEADVRKVNFKFAALALGLLGGGNILPAGYTRLEYLETIVGDDHINTGITPGGKILSAEVDACILEAGIDVAFLLGSVMSISSNEFRIGLFQGKNRVKLNSSAATGSTFDTSRKIYYINRPQGSGVGAEVLLSAAPVAIAEANNRPVYLFRSNAGGYTNGINGNDRSRKRIYGCRIWDGDKMVGDYIPALDRTGAPCMYDTVSGIAKDNAGTGQFIVGMTLAQVRGLRLPDGGGKLTLSLPHEASIDMLAQAALERARANGWLLTLQYSEAEAEVPAGYRKLEFLEGTGTQYIDTGYVPNNETGILLDQEKLSLGDFIPMGSRNDTNNTRFYALRSTYGNTRAGTGYGWGAWNSFDRITGRQKTKLNYLNSRKVEGEQTAVLPELPFVPNQSIYMFAANIAGVPSLLWTGRIYSAAISRAGEIQVDYVPCIAPNGKLGMYNKVDGTVKENAGSGAFIAGLATVDDVRNLWLPETGGPLTVSVPAETPDSAVNQLRENNPTWQIAIQYRTDNEN